MGQHKDELQAAGLHIAAVGLGEPKHAQRYCGKLAPGIDCLTHTTTEPYYAYGLRQATAKELASVSLFAASARALVKGYRQGEATGDVRMLPGTFIIDREGTIVYTYYSKHAGDDPNIHDLVEAAHRIDMS